MDTRIICDSTLRGMEFVYLDAFPAGDAVIFGTHHWNTVPDRSAPEFLVELEDIRKRGGDTVNYATFEFRPHAAIQLRQLSGRLDGRQTLAALQELFQGVLEVLRDEVMLGMATPAGFA